MKKFNSLVFLVVILSWIFTSAFQPLPQNADFCAIAAPNAFTKVSPINVTDQPVRGITLQWNALDGATSYQYCIRAGKAACNGNHWVSVGNKTTVSLPQTLSANTTYYWQVRATSTSTTYADNGKWASFKTGSGAPTNFSKLTPALTANTNLDLTVHLSWEASANARYYDYCLSTSNVPCVTWIPVGNVLFKDISGLAYGTTYYWQVRARIYTTTPSGSVTQANGGAMWNFTTKPAPPAPFNKISPSNTASSQPTNVTLQWGPSTNVTQYKLCVQTSEGCTAAQEINAGTSTTFDTTSLNLALNTTYYWQVFAVNGTSRTAADEGVWHTFKTWVNPPASTDFQKISPADKETNVSLTPWLYWAAPSGKSGFEYCVSTTSDCASNAWTTVSANAIIKPAALTNNTTYYWQIRYPEGGGYIYADAKSFTFTTVKAGPSASDVTVSIAEDTVLNRTLTATSNYGKTFEILGALPNGVALNANFASNGMFTYTPAANYNGTVSFLYAVNDGVNQPAGPYTVTITVTGVNDAPVVSPVVLEQATYLPGDTIIEVIDVNDPDFPYGDTVSFSIVGSLPAGATFDAANGVFVWTIPDTQAAGTVPVTIKATDSQGASSQTTMNIVIGGIPVTGGGGFVYIPMINR